MPFLSRMTMPLLRSLPAERAHSITLKALQMGLHHTLGLKPALGQEAMDRLACQVWDIKFPNPLGLAAGFDKNGEVIDPMLSLGFGFVEIGSVTPRPQAGNPKPRLFRLTKDQAIINRMGFNNEGIAAVAARVASWRSSVRAHPGVLGVNLGKNKDSEDAAADYSLGAARFARISDYIVINVSSPNTPGLRALQSKDALRDILLRTRDSLQGAADSPQGLGADQTDKAPPLLVKLAPDLQEQDIQDLAALALEGVCDGLIISNTTIARPDTLKSPQSRTNQTGGLSGAPLYEASTELLAKFSALTQGQIPLIGVGGIRNGADAYQKIRAGASLVQLYSGLVYGGPESVGNILSDLADLLQKDGFKTVQDAVGVDVQHYAKT